MNRTDEMTGDLPPHADAAASQVRGSGEESSSSAAGNDKRARRNNRQSDHRAVLPSPNQQKAQPHQRRQHHQQQQPDPAMQKAVANRYVLRSGQTTPGRIEQRQDLNSQHDVAAAQEDWWAQWSSEQKNQHQRRQHQQQQERHRQQHQHQHQQQQDRNQQQQEQHRQDHRQQQNQDHQQQVHHHQPSQGLRREPRQFQQIRPAQTRGNGIPSAVARGSRQVHHDRSAGKNRATAGQRVVGPIASRAATAHSREDPSLPPRPLHQSANRAPMFRQGQEQKGAERHNDPRNVGARTSHSTSSPSARSTSGERSQQYNAALERKRNIGSNEGHQSPQRLFRQGQEQKGTNSADTSTAQQQNDRTRTSHASTTPGAPRTSGARSQQYSTALENKRNIGSSDEGHQSPISVRAPAMLAPEEEASRVSSFPSAATADDDGSGSLQLENLRRSNNDPILHPTAQQDEPDDSNVIRPGAQRLYPSNYSEEDGSVEESFNDDGQQPYEDEIQQEIGFVDRDGARAPVEVHAYLVEEEEAPSEVESAAQQEGEPIARADPVQQQQKRRGRDDDNNGKVVLFICVGCMITLVIVVVVVAVSMVQVLGPNNNRGAASAEAATSAGSNIPTSAPVGFPSTLSDGLAPQAITPTPTAGEAPSRFPLTGSVFSSSPLPTPSPTLSPFTDNPNDAPSPNPIGIVPSQMCVPGLYYFKYGSPNSETPIGRVDASSNLGTSQDAIVADCQLTSLAFDASRTAYGICMDQRDVFVTVDLATGGTGEIFRFPEFYGAYALTYNPADGRFYVRMYEFNLEEYFLATIVRNETGWILSSSTADYVPNEGFTSLAISSDGNAFAIDFNILLSVDLTTGGQVRLGSLDVDMVFSSGFDGSDNLYAIAHSGPLVAIQVNGTDVTTREVKPINTQSVGGGAFCPL